MIQEKTHQHQTSYSREGKLLTSAKTNENHFQTQSLGDNLRAFLNLKCITNINAV